jgi:hypothetical protein
MARQYVTGPAHLFVGVFDRVPKYLGTAERWPKITERPNFSPTFNDAGGHVPFDVAYEGNEAFTVAQLSRWTEVVYAQLANRPHRSQFGRGTNVNGDIGTLMVQEGRTYPLWVWFPYAALKPAAFPDMPAGYRFPNAYLAGPDDLEPLGTTPRKVMLIFHALRGFDAGKNTFLLYDHDMSGISQGLVD